MPVTTASASEVTNRVMKGFSLKTAIRTMRLMTAIRAEISRKML
jgi:hypothetical protein